MYNTIITNHKRVTENETQRALYSKMFTILLSSATEQIQIACATAVVVVFVWQFVIARQFADMIRVGGSICSGGECRSAPLVHDDRLLAED